MKQCFHMPEFTSWFFRLLHDLSQGSFLCFSGHNIISTVRFDRQNDFDQPIHSCDIDYSVTENGG